MKTCRIAVEFPREMAERGRRLGCGVWQIVGVIVGGRKFTNGVEDWRAFKGYYTSREDRKPRYMAIAARYLPFLGFTAHV